MAGMMRLAGAFSSKARQPMKQRVMVMGDRLATVSADSANVIDLGKETMTEINFDKKTYSVVTFAEWADAMNKLQAKMQSKQQQADVKYKVSLKDTGQTRQIAGLNARQMLMIFAIEGANQQTGELGSLNMIAEMWVAPEVPGYGEVRNFYRRLAQKMAWTPGMGGMMGAQPGVAKGMAEVAREASKLDGVPVLQITYVGVAQEAVAQAEAGKAPQPTPAGAEQQGPSARQAAGDAAGSTAERSAASAITGRLGRLGGFGGLGRRKPKEEAPAPAPQAQQQAQGTAALMEMTTELTGFSATADASKFEVPAGFKKVESELVKASRK